MDAQPAILSLGVLAAFALAFGGALLIVRRRDRKRGVLMVAAALVLLVNVLLWAWPMPAQAAPPLPADVRNFLARRADCAHWRGEDPYDRARARRIAQGASHACAHANADFRRLRLRYRGNWRVLKAIERPAE